MIANMIANILITLFILSLLLHIPVVQRMVITLWIIITDIEMVLIFGVDWKDEWQYIKHGRSNGN